MSNLHKGDKVTWNSQQGKINGKVDKKITTDTRFGGKIYRATKDDPKVLVTSDKTGKKAIHNPDSVKKN